MSDKNLERTVGLLVAVSAIAAGVAFLQSKTLQNHDERLWGRLEETNKLRHRVEDLERVQGLSEVPPYTPKEHLRVFEPVQDFVDAVEAVEDDIEEEVKKVVKKRPLRSVQSES